MPQDDVPFAEQDIVVAALGSHFHLLAQLLHQARASEGLQAMYAPLLASSEQLSRGLGEGKSPSWEQGLSSATGEAVDTRGLPQSRSPEGSSDARPACEGSSDARPACEAMPSKSQEWAEDQEVLEEMKRTPDNLRRASENSDKKLTKNAPRAFSSLRSIVGNARYEAFWAAVVLLNTCTMVLEEEWAGISSGNRIGFYKEYGSEEYMNLWWPNAREAFFGIDFVFSLLFTVEVILTFTYDIWNLQLGFICHHRLPFWKNPWDWFDLVVVVSSNLALFAGFREGPLSNARFLRVFRLVRLLRLVRLVRRINSLDPLHLMTTAIRGSANALVFSILLLLLIQTIFAMLMTEVLRLGWLSEESSLSKDVQVKLFGYFGTYTRSVVTMFELALANYPTVCRFLMDEVHEVFGHLVVFYKLSLGLSVIGVINAVFIQETFATAANDEFIMVRKRIHQMEHHKLSITRLFKMADRDMSDSLTRDEFSQLLQKDFIRTYLEAMELPCSDPDKLFRLIAGHRQDVSIDEFIAGIGRLKGAARNIDVVTVLDNLKHTTHDMHVLVEEVVRRDSSVTDPGHQSSAAPKTASVTQLRDGA